MRTDRIFIEGMRLKGRHGVHEAERRLEQEFVVDLRVEFDTSRASISDKIGDTVDYSECAKIAEREVEQSSYYLIERLADAIAQKILADRRITEAVVTIRKPAALRNGVPGVTISRQRK